MLGLIGCSKSKHGEGTGRLFEAQALYDSWLFDLRREAVEAHCTQWAILSAEHELLHPEDEILYYDTHISERDAEQWASAVAGQMEASGLHERFDSVLILAGRDYVDPLQPHLDAFGFDVWDPLEGVRLFQQRTELADLIEEARPSTQADLGDW